MTNKEKKDRTIAAFSTLIVMVALFLFMSFCGLKYLMPPPPAKKVILIEMSMEGGGGGGGNLQSQSKTNVTAPAENWQTQQDLSLPSIPTSKNRNISTSADAVQEITEVKANPNAAYRPGMGGGSGGGAGTGKGTGIGSGFGDGEGSGSGGNIGYGTGNRGYLHMPDLTVNEVGTVYVEVHVDASGTVLNARVINSRTYPTTITSSAIQAECVTKAKTARYKPGKEELRIIVFSL